MESHGYTYDDPAQIEVGITELNRTQNFNDIPGLLESRDECLAAVESATERLVLPVRALLEDRALGATVYVWQRT